MSDIRETVADAIEVGLADTCPADAWNTDDPRPECVCPDTSRIEHVAVTALASLRQHRDDIARVLMETRLPSGGYASLNDVQARHLADAVLDLFDPREG